MERGRELCAGVRSANPGKRWGDVLELRYCEDRTLQEIAGTLGVSVRSIQADLLTGWTSPASPVRDKGEELPRYNLIIAKIYIVITISIC